MKNVIDRVAKLSQDSYFRGRDSLELWAFSTLDQ